MEPDTLVEDPVRVLRGLVIETDPFAAFSKHIVGPLGVRIRAVLFCLQRNSERNQLAYSASVDEHAQVHASWE